MNEDNFFKSLETINQERITPRECEILYDLREYSRSNDDSIPFWTAIIEVANNRIMELTPLITE